MRPASCSGPPTAIRTQSPLSWHILGSLPASQSVAMADGSSRPAEMAMSHSGALTAWRLSVAQLLRALVQNAGGMPSTMVRAWRRFSGDLLLP